MGIIQPLQRPTMRLVSTRQCTLLATRQFYSTCTSNPLRLLFCGSDEFSSASLRALHQEQLRSPQSIASIDVLIRPGKPSGRGLKTKREVPIKSVAHELGLPVHERDTFTGWTLPRPNGKPINLIIAVSFGLFVPPRILKSAEHGGVNVHPSMLPDFRGPAPLHHTLLANETHTGVTLQTLHPEKFDHGKILLQTPSPGFEIPNASQCTYHELLNFITPKAAEMLVKGIRDRVFLPSVPRVENGPVDENTRSSSSPVHKGGQLLRHAPKITTEDRLIDWKTMTAEEILRRHRVLGRTWSFFQSGETQKKRIMFDGLSAVPNPIKLQQRLGTGEEEGGGGVQPLTLFSKEGDRITVPCFTYREAIVIPVSGTGGVLVDEITVEGSPKMSAAKALSHLFRV